MSSSDDSIDFLFDWAADIRRNSGNSVDADKLDAIGTEIASLRSSVASLVDALTDAQGVLATLIDADSIGKVASSTVYFQAKAAESKARAAIARATEVKS